MMSSDDSKGGGPMAATRQQVRLTVRSEDHHATCGVSAETISALEHTRPKPAANLALVTGSTR